MILIASSTELSAARLTGGSMRKPTLVMPSVFLWTVLVSSALCAPAPVNLGFELHAHHSLYSKVQAACA